MSLPGKRYLGDGVYVEIESDMVKLTTEDGITATNTIYLEEPVINALCRYWDDVIKATNS
jgi:hypothetical protein